MTVRKVHHKDLEPQESEVVSRMRGELKVILILFVIYAFYLAMVPILNFTAPEFMGIRVWGGMSLTWFLTAIGGAFMSFAIAGAHVFFYTRDFYISRCGEDNVSKGVGK